MKTQQPSRRDSLMRSAFKPGSVLSIMLIALAAIPAVLLAQYPRGVSNTSRNPSGYASANLTTDYEGFTIPKFDIMVAATEIGRLEEVNVEIGDRVTRGQTIAKLEDGLQIEAVATAQWRAQMHGETDAAKAETALKALRLEQLKTLAKQEITRPDELKRAVADWEIAKARELAAIEQDQLRKLELSRYELQLKRRKVLAPMDGIVAELFHRPGEYITPADPAVIRLVVLDELYGVFNIPVEDMKYIETGNLVSVFLTSSTSVVEGKIASIAPDIDGESGTIKVKVLLDNREGKLRSGDRCRMTPFRNKPTSTVPERRTSRRPSTTKTFQRIGVSSQREVSGIR